MSSQQKFTLNTYADYDIEFESAHGVWLYDSNQKKYCDFASCFSVMNLGHGHPKWLRTLYEQAQKITFTSNLYKTKIREQSAYDLCQSTGLHGGVWFCNSGTEANEAALKCLRLYGSKKNKSNIISLKNSFHGRTMGALRLTGSDRFRNLFGPDPEGFTYCEANNIEQLESLFDSNISGIILETVQGEGGIIPLEKSFIQHARQLCDQHDALMVIDEIQTGCGRTGLMWSYNHFDILPDIMTTAKALGGGFPIGAMVVGEHLSDIFSPGQHGSTFGGNPLAVALSQTVIKEIQHILPKTKKLQARLKKELEDIVNQSSICKEIRGLGFFWGIELTEDLTKIISLCHNNGLLVVPASQNTIRIMPPLIISDEELNYGIKILRKVLCQQA